MSLDQEPNILKIQIRGFDVMHTGPAKTKLTRTLANFIKGSPILLIACGGVTNPAGVGPDGAAGAQGQGYSLAGEWVGLYKAKQTDTSTVRETKAKLTIEPTGNLIGQFKLELPAYDSANVTAMYRDFAGKSLMIDITASNFSTLGLTGSKTDLPYELVGDALELGNERFTLKLARQGKTQEDTSNSTNNGSTSLAPSSDLVGRWTCQDSSRYAWKINMKSSTNFAVDILDTVGTQASVWMDGSATTTAQGSLYTATLRIDASDVTKYVGKTLILTQKEKDTATLTKPDERTPTLACVRTKA
jgi:hypothetical protein